MKRLRVDLNCDLGEGAGNDRLIMPFITSANIACGAHAGDEETMDLTIQLAQEQGVAVGAHPGFPDKEGFGRRPLFYKPPELRGLLERQLELFLRIADKRGVAVQHVKPHGALYNQAVEDAEVAAVIAETVYRMNPALILVGLSGSQLIRAGKDLGLNVASEVFADRRYARNGTLVSRTRPHAVIHEISQCFAQIEKMMQEEKVVSEEGIVIAVQPDTICIHGDNPEAVHFARAIGTELGKWGIELRNFKSRIV